ncbi:hypothetical protein [Ferrimonas gelatinilytica]|uniref:Haemolysin activator HlyB C-terminal domain-containing protein n=1 Tax=Ferrimonas gelatinilytica TaxID=1255257 RepID=A0ABP9RUW5_9GAMM
MSPARALLWSVLSLPVVAQASDAPAEEPANEHHHEQDDAKILAQLQAQCEAAPEYRYIRHNVFQPDEPGFTWAHKLANKLHYTTREVTLEQAVAGFTPCEDDLDDLYELERHLRGLRYLRDAQVSQDKESGQVLVETWDTWSLLPTFNFSRQGGENAASIGIKDSNLLGLGIDAQIFYFSDYQRDGYQLAFYSPIYINKHINVGIRLANTSDGKQVGFQLDRPFVALDSAFGYELSLFRDQRQEEIRQGDQEVNRFDHDLHYFHVGYGRRWLEGRDQVLRWHVGLTFDDHQFDPVAGTTRLPEDRQRAYPWVQLSFRQDRFEELQNVTLINAIEDVNLGWDSAVKLGWDGSGDGGWLLQAHSHWGALFGAKRRRFSEPIDNGSTGLWLTRFWLHGEEVRGAGDYYQLQWRNELFYPIWAPLRVYGKFDWRHAINPFVDRPHTLGGSTGLRGYPLQYQHGDTIALATAELRYYPGISILQLLELGSAIFYDIGEARGGEAYPDNPAGTQQSLGAGLRFYASHAGSRNVIHVDFVRPISDDKRVNSWEWRLEVKSHF